MNAVQILGWWRRLDRPALVRWAAIIVVLILWALVVSHFRPTYYGERDVTAPSSR